MPWRDRKGQGLGHLSICLPFLSSVPVGRDKGTMWPLTVLGEMSGRDREPADHSLGFCHSG